MTKQTIQLVTDPGVTKFSHDGRQTTQLPTTTISVSIGAVNANIMEEPFGRILMRFHLHASMHKPARHIKIYLSFHVHYCIIYFVT